MIRCRNIEEGGEHSFADYLQTPEPTSVVIPGGAKRRPGIHSGSNGGGFPPPAFAGAGFAGMTISKRGLTISNKVMRDASGGISVPVLWAKY